jgi:uncharacterized protein (DUF3084 family)
VQQTNEKRARKQVRERKIGEAKAISFDEILEAKRLRECAEAEDARKKIERERKKAEREEKKAEKERQKALKEQAKAEKEREKAEMSREKAAKAKSGVNTRPRVTSMEPARKKRANIGEAALDRQYIKAADLSAYCSVLSFEATE